MNDQPVPQVSEADIARIVAREFSPKHAAEVVLALGEYRKQSWHREVIRVRVAILKLANGRLDRLSEAIQTATKDYRDVLSQAEYPRYFQEFSPSENDALKRSKAIAADWRHDEEWLRKN